MVEGHKSAEREKPVKPDEHVEHKDSAESAAATPPKLYDLASKALEEMSLSGTFRKISSAVSDLVDAPNIFKHGEQKSTESDKHGDPKNADSKAESLKPQDAKNFEAKADNRTDKADASKADLTKPSVTLASNFNSFTFAPLSAKGFEPPPVVQVYDAQHNKGTENNEVKPPPGTNAPYNVLQAPDAPIQPYNTFQPSNLLNNFKTVEVSKTQTPMDTRNMDMTRGSTEDPMQPKLVKTISITGPAPGYEGPTGFRPASEFAGGDKQPTIVELKTHTVPLDVAQNKPSGGLLAELNKGGFIAGACDTEEAKRNTSLSRNTETNQKPYTLDATTNSFLPSRLDFKDDHPKNATDAANVVGSKSDKSDLNSIMFNKDPIAYQNVALTAPSLTRDTTAQKETRTADGGAANLANTRSTEGNGNLTNVRSSTNDILFNPERIENQRLPLGSGTGDKGAVSVSNTNLRDTSGTKETTSDRVGSGGTADRTNTQIDRTCVLDKNAPELPRDTKGLLEALKGNSNSPQESAQNQRPQENAPNKQNVENVQTDKGNTDQGKGNPGSQNFESVKGNPGNLEKSSQGGGTADGGKGNGNLDSFKQGNLDKGSADTNSRTNIGGGDARVDGSKGAQNQGNTDRSESRAESKTESKGSENRSSSDNRTTSNDTRTQDYARNINDSSINKNDKTVDQSRTLEPVQNKVAESAPKAAEQTKTEPEKTAIDKANAAAAEVRKAESNPEPVRQAMAAAASADVNTGAGKQQVQMNDLAAVGTLARASMQQGGANSLESFAAASKSANAATDASIGVGDRGASKVIATATGFELTGPVSLSALAARTAAGSTSGADQILGQSAVKTNTAGAEIAATLKTGALPSEAALASAAKSQLSVQGSTEIPSSLANALNSGKGIFDPQGIGKTFNLDANGKLIQSTNLSPSMQNALAVNANIGNGRIGGSSIITNSPDQLGITRSGRPDTVIGAGKDPITARMESNLTAKTEFTGRPEANSARFDPITGRIVPVSEKAGEFNGLELSQLQKSLTSGEKRYLTGVEIALAVAIASAAVAKAKPEGEKDDPSDGAPENAELQVTYTNADGTVSTAQITSLFKRPTYLVQPNDTLVDIAEKHFHNSDVAWLIADINALRISEHMEEGKRIIELRSRQEIELPLPSEVNEFLLAKKADAKADNMVTIIGTTEIDRELLNNFLSTVVGGELSAPIGTETTNPEMLPVPAAPPLMHLVNFGKSLTQNLMPTMTALRQQGHNLRTYISKIDLVPHRNVHGLEPQR